MKRCPTCKRTFEDSLSFCLDDGTPLADDSGPDSEATLVSPSPAAGGRSVLQETQAYNQLPGRPTWAGSLQNPGQPQPYVAPSPTRKVWPWVVGIILLLLFGGGVVAGVAVMVMHGNQPSPNVNRPSPSPSPTVSPEEEPSPSASPSVVASDVPTDPDEVKSTLSDLEDEWTEANVKGDKSALEQILADDYSGGSPPETKEHYLRNLKPDPTVQSWDIGDLEVTQKGDRATVHGVLTEETTRGAETYRFTDTFVWRDHRWQAVGSVANRVESP